MSYIRYYIHVELVLAHGRTYIHVELVLANRSFNIYMGDAIQYNGCRNFESTHNVLSQNLSHPYYSCHSPSDEYLKNLLWYASYKEVVSFMYKTVDKSRLVDNSREEYPLLLIYNVVAHYLPYIIILL